MNKTMLCIEILHLLSTKNIMSKNELADITVSAVSLETLEQAVKAFERFGRASSVIQIAVTETRKVGGHTMLTAQNPIFIIKGGQQ